MKKLKLRDEEEFAHVIQSLDGQAGGCTQHWLLI